jgi:hypothetical protein
MTHDYVRHGTTTLFAALDVLQGTVKGSVNGIVMFDRTIGVRTKHSILLKNPHFSKSTRKTALAFQ